MCGRNMDIIGVPGIAAEAELLAAIVLFLERVNLSSEDIVIKVSSRKVLQAILERYNVPEDSVGPVSVVVDKMEKIPLEKVVPLSNFNNMQAPRRHLTLWQKCGQWHANASVFCAMIENLYCMHA